MEGHPGPNEYLLLRLDLVFCSLGCMKLAGFRAKRAVDGDMPRLPTVQAEIFFDSALSFVSAQRSARARRVSGINFHR